MIARKDIDDIIKLIVGAAVILCLFLVLAGPELWGGAEQGVSMEYEQRLFDTEEPLRVDITIPEEDWEAMLARPMADEYYSCDVTITGSRFTDVGIKPKGSTSLAFLAGTDSLRYSLKLEFDHFIDGQTCFGLDKLALNNSYGDPSCLREALSYDMFRSLGADASLYNFAEIYVNGEYWGMFLALECVEDAYLLRNYGTAQGGHLYKPEMMGDGSNLNYTDDELSSYSAIWLSERTEGNDADHRRVVTALRHISEGTDLEEYLDVDNVLRYMAVHNFVVNNDSLSGGLAHNYYLYEQGGALNLLPWDYNLAFGTMIGSSRDATVIVNTTIDDHWRSTRFFNALLDDEEYLAKYHAYYRQLVEEYIFGGGFESFFQHACAVTEPLVKADPNVLFSFDEYLAARDALHELVLLRGESVLRQLDGTIPSTTAGRGGSASGEFPFFASGEPAEPEDAEDIPEFELVDASHVDMSDMGSIGGGFGGGPFSRGGASAEPGSEAEETASSEASDEPAATASFEASEEPTGTDSGEEASPSGEPSGEFPFASGEMRHRLTPESIWTLIACVLVLSAGMVFAVRFRKKG